MCGILGIVSPNFKMNHEWVKANLNKLKHRGPDNEGLWQSKDSFVTLGHTRLSIIDLSSQNNQPFFDNDNNICISFNGEIYNYVELRKELIQRGYKFETKGDTEVLLKSYIEWKEESFKKIEGMFSFCIHDQKKGKIFLVRDQYGQKPLYYSYKNEILKFGSELRIFLNEKNNKVHIQNLNKFLFNGYISNETLLENIYQVKPGSYIEFEYLKKKINFKSQWIFPKNLNQSYFDRKKILSLLKESIVKQLRSDVPIGFLLSGGIDSSLLVSLASELSDKKLNTYTVSYSNNDSIIESESALEISKIYNTNHQNIKLDTFKIDNFFNILEKFDEPIIDSSVIPTFSIYEKIKNNCKVVFGGDGGDEIFGGYNHYKNYLRINLLNKISFNLSSILKLYLNKKKIHYLKGNMYIDLLGNHEKIIEIPNYFNEIERKEIFDDKSLYLKNKSNLISSNDIVTDGMKKSFLNYLPQDIMFKIDRCSMLNSLEARAPYLDNKLVSYIFKHTKGSDHVSMFETRKIQKEIAKNYIPSNILKQKKRGFSFNMRENLKKEDWKNEIYSFLSSNDSIFSKKYITRLFLLNNQNYNVSEKIFGLLFFEIWRRKFKPFI